ncbi:MAG: bifunctional methylenetetrahydrofolate dehydrogenase/methenyltetrahydrofolate cyclohydrolase FolD [Ignavibacteriaceae bacterium]|nr:bifunctional methylenetetrahydrofolate dehydrogenase/methenyltetrahydrofolate cyclohydrolase FolD [Ignavibacteriaceae bacterium]
MILIDGKKIAGEIKEEIKSKVTGLVKEGKKVPGLVTILVGDDPGSQIYVNNKHKACREAGMRSKSEIFNAQVSEKELLDVISSYNNNEDYHGILVQLPLPANINKDNIIEAISPKKDVDGLHPVSIGNLVAGKDTFIPCTPAGIQELLKRYNIETSGRHVVVLGRSNIVGKPVANLMMQKNKYANAIVTVCHSASKDLAQYTRTADILIAAIGKPNFVKENMVKEGVVVIDVGINRIKDDTHPNGSRVVGDVDFSGVSGKASYITPVPGGVGVMTVAMLLINTYKAYLKYGG